MQISIQALEPNFTLVSLNGRLDATASPEVKATLRRLVGEGHRKIVVDLHQVPFIDSSGLASLVSGLRLAREQDSTVVLCNIQTQAQIVFQLTMLDRIFAIYPNLEEATQYLA
jgi:anti-anti-sigma factor